MNPRWIEEMSFRMGEVYGAVAQGIPGIEALAGIPICSAIGDQQAALFGQCCFEEGSEEEPRYG